MLPVSKQMRYFAVDKQ